MHVPTKLPSGPASLGPGPPSVLLPSLPLPSVLLPSVPFPSLGPEPSLPTVPLASSVFASDESTPPSALVPSSVKSPSTL